MGSPVAAANSALSFVPRRRRAATADSRGSSCGRPAPSPAAAPAPPAPPAAATGRRRCRVRGAGPRRAPSRASVRKPGGGTNEYRMSSPRLTACQTRAIVQVSRRWSPSPLVARRASKPVEDAPASGVAGVSAAFLLQHETRAGRPRHAPRSCNFTTLQDRRRSRAALAGEGRESRKAFCRRAPKIGQVRGGSHVPAGVHPCRSVARSRKFAIVAPRPRATRAPARANGRVAAWRAIPPSGRRSACRTRSASGRSPPGTAGRRRRPRAS